jgi:hypothetical protein
MSGFLTFRRLLMASTIAAGMLIAAPARADLRIQLTEGSNHLILDNLTSGQTVSGTFQDFSYTFTITSNNGGPVGPVAFTRLNASVTNNAAAKEVLFVQYSATGFTFPGTSNSSNMGISTVLTSNSSFPNDDSVLSKSDETGSNSVSHGTPYVQLYGPGGGPGAVVSSAKAPGTASATYDIGPIAFPFSETGSNNDVTFHAGDTLNYTSITEVEVTPEPSALFMGLLGLPLGGFLVWRLRRRSFREVASI